MKRIFGKFLGIFGFVTVLFLISSCSGSRLIWCASNGIVTYNRHTGQFEMLWDHQEKRMVVIRDTVYVNCKDSVEQVR